MSVRTFVGIRGIFLRFDLWYFREMASRPATTSATDARPMRRASLRTVQESTEKDLMAFVARLGSQEMRQEDCRSTEEGTATGEWSLCKHPTALGRCF